MDKKWIIIVEPEYTVHYGRIVYALKVIEYDHPQMFLAPDREAAIDYCEVVLKIKEKDIL